MHAIAAACGGVNRAVNGPKAHTAGQLGGSINPGRLERLAVATPGGVKLQPGVVQGK